MDNGDSTSTATPFPVRDTARNADEQAEEETAYINVGAVLSSEGSCFKRGPPSPQLTEV